MNKNAIYFTAAIGFLLSGCGGGGGSGAPTAPAVTPAPPVTVAPVTPVPQVIVVQLNAAVSALYSLPHDFNNTVKSPAGDTYNARVVYSNIVDTNIESLAVKSVDIKRTILKNDAPLQSSSETSFFQLNPYRLVSSKSMDNPLYIVASNQVALPTTAKPGDSGAYYDSTTFDSTGKNLILSTAKHTWSLSSESATTVLFCDNSVISIAQISGTTTRADCYQIDTNSNVVSNRLVIPQ